MSQPRKRTPKRQDLMEVYQRLFQAHGPRNWWPTMYGGKFEMVCGAILTQNTTWRNVEKALLGMRTAGFWSWEALHSAGTQELADSIRSSGYFNTKARKLKEFASVIVAEHQGELENLLAFDLPDLRRRLLGIWGIGEETADDIILYAANKPSFVIDKYTMRIVDRIGWRTRGSTYADYQHLFTSLLPADAPLYNEFHALLDGHAAKTCKTTPVCDECCLADLCRFGHQESGRGRPKSSAPRA